MLPFFVKFRKQITYHIGKNEKAYLQSESKIYNGQGRIWNREKPRRNTGKVPEACRSGVNLTLRHMRQVTKMRGWD